MFNIKSLSRLTRWGFFLVVGCQLSVVGCLLSVVCYWLRVSGFGFRVVYKIMRFLSRQKRRDEMTKGRLGFFGLTAKGAKKARRARRVLLRIERIKTDF